MDGGLPLGYDPDGRTLRINEAEAEVERHIFRRYLELGWVHKLEVELKAQGYRSKTWMAASSGRVHGGLPFTRGPLFHILSSRLYLGEIPHKAGITPANTRPSSSLSCSPRCSSRWRPTQDRAGKPRPASRHGSLPRR